MLERIMLNFRHIIQNMSQPWMKVFEKVLILSREQDMSTGKNINSLKISGKSYLFFVKKIKSNFFVHHFQFIHISYLEV